MEVQFTGTPSEMVNCLLQAKLIADYHTALALVEKSRVYRCRKYEQYYNLVYAAVQSKCPFVLPLFRKSDRIDLSPLIGMTLRDANAWIKRQPSAASIFKGNPPGRFFSVVSWQDGNAAQIGR